MAHRLCSAETASAKFSTRSLCRDGLKPVLVVKAAQNGRGRDAIISTNRVAGALSYWFWRSPIGNTWTEARVRPAVIVMRNPFSQDSPEMPLIDRNHPIQTLTTCSPDHAFAIGIRLRHRNRCLQDA